MVLDRIELLERQVSDLRRMVEVMAAMTMPPMVVDVPYVSGADILTCTMGNWMGMPTAYRYQWRRGTTNVGTDSNTYTVVAADAEQPMTCVVTAANANGSTAAPPSNIVVPPPVQPAASAATATRK
jgi:hypothetical protein